MSHQWYERIPGRDRATVDALAAWVNPIPWQLFATATFPWNVRPETADRKFKQLINELERAMKTRVCYLAGKESRTKSGGSSPAILMDVVDSVPATWDI